MEKQTTAMIKVQRQLQSDRAAMEENERECVCVLTSGVEVSAGLMRDTRQRKLMEERKKRRETEGEKKRQWHYETIRARESLFPCSVLCDEIKTTGAMYSSLTALSSSSFFDSSPARAVILFVFFHSSLL